MQQGEYIVDRWLVEAVIAICRDNDISLKKYSQDWILELEHDGRRGKIFGYKFSLNNSASANAAQDKVGAYEILAARGVSAVPHALVRTKVGDVPLHEDWNELVIKPLTGTSGHLVQRCNRSELRAVMEHSPVEAWAVAPYVQIDRETRLIMMDDECLLAYDKHPLPTDRLTMYNLGKGATPSDVTPTDEQVRVARAGKGALGLTVCAVDIIETSAGEQLVLEVNDGIMMEYYARYSSKNKLRARNVYDRIIRRMFQE